MPFILSVQIYIFFVFFKIKSPDYFENNLTILKEEDELLYKSSVF